MSVLTLTACSSVPVDTYAAAKPALVLEKYFAGETKAHGVFEDRFGRVRRTFTVDITGTWDADQQSLKLVEDFVYNDGETEQRIWTIRKDPTKAGRYTGTAAGVVGQAVGQTSGNALFWAYDFNLPVGDSVWHVHFDDRMYLLDDKTLFNKAVIRKWGVRLGDVYLTFTKP